MKTLNFHSKDPKQIKSLLVLHNHLLDFFFFVARAKKTAVRFSFTIEDDHGNSDIEYYTLSSIGYPGEIPPEFQKFLEDYSTRLIAERNILSEQLEDLQEQLIHLHQNQNL